MYYELLGQGRNYNKMKPLLPFDNEGQTLGELSHSMQCRFFYNHNHDIMDLVSMKPFVSARYSLPKLISNSGRKFKRN